MTCSWCFQTLGCLSGAFPAAREDAHALAMGAVNIIAAYGERQRWTEMQLAFHILQQAAHRFPE